MKPDYTTIMDKLIDALYQGGGLQAIANIGYELLGNPIIICDNSRKLLAWSSNFVPDNAVLLSSFEKGYYIENIATLKQHTKDIKIHVENMHQSREPVFLPADSLDEDLCAFLPYGIIGIGIRIQGMFVGNMSVVGVYKQFNEFDYDCITKLSKLASMELQKNELFIQNRGLKYESLLFDLLEERITDQSVLDLRFRALGKTLGNNLYIAAVRRLDSENSVHVIPAINQAHIRRYFAQSISLVYKNDIVLLVSGDNSGYPFGNMESLISFLKNNKLKLGISKVFSNTQDVRRFYTQSIKAIELGIHLNELDVIYEYDHYSIYHALEICSEHINLRDLCHPELLRLKVSPDPVDRELFHTLYIYLRYFKDIAKVADELHIHKNTLFYRIKKIKKIIGKDLEEDGASFNLMFSIEIMKYVAAFHTNESHLLNLSNEIKD